MVSTNIFKLWLPTLIRIHLVIEVEDVEEWKVEKILNKIKIKGVVKYLIWWKKFTVDNNI